MTLLEFVSYLADNKMIEVTKLKDKNEDGFQNRLKIQKYVYLAQYFGLDLGYRYNIHLYGPYSPDLTKDYFKLNLDNMIPSSAPSALKVREFLSALNGKTSDWLEIAATILFERKINQNVSRQHLYYMKPDHPTKFINSVYEDVSNLNIR